MKEWKLRSALLGSALGVAGLTLSALAQDPPAQCIEEQVKIQQITQQNSQLLKQVAQLQFQLASQQEIQAKAEEERLQKSMPPKAETPPAAPAAPTQP